MKKDEKENKKKSIKENEAARKEFIREQIKPDRANFVRKITERLIVTLAIAFFFGAVAGLTLYFVGSVLKIRFPGLEDSSDSSPAIEISIPSNSPASTEKPFVAPISQSEIKNVKNYGEIRNKLAYVGESCYSYMANVYTSKHVKDWFDSQVSDEKNKNGVVFKFADGIYYIMVTGWESENIDEVYVKFGDSSRIKSEVIGHDSELGIAVLSVSEEDIKKDIREQISVARFSDSTLCNMGDLIIAIGSPNGVQGSVQIGSVVNKDITIPVTDDEISVLMTDINYVNNANGVVVDTEGNILGIIDVKANNLVGGEGMIFVGISDIIDYINELSTNQDATYLGIKGVDVTSDAMEDQGLPEGIYITEVNGNSPALEGGLRIADTIISIDGEKVKSMSDVNRFLRLHKEEDVIKITLVRGEEHKKQTLKIELGVRE